MAIGFTCFLARDNADLRKFQDIVRYECAYFSDNTEVTIELQGIDLMFASQKAMPLPINKYRKYMKERKNTRSPKH